MAGIALNRVVYSSSSHCEEPAKQADGAVPSAQSLAYAEIALRPYGALAMTVSFAVGCDRNQFSSKDQGQ